jgi:hypothetical protein
MGPTFENPLCLIRIDLGIIFFLHYNYVICNIIARGQCTRLLTEENDNIFLAFKQI